jgi:hypothetical protein
MKHETKHKNNTDSSIRKKLKFDASGKCTNAFEIISNIETLKLAYETIKSKPGNMVKGSDSVTLDGISDK